MLTSNSLVKHDFSDEGSVNTVYIVCERQICTSNAWPNAELAAIIVKFAKETSRSLNDSSAIGLGVSLPEVRGYPNSRDNEE